MMATARRIITGVGFPVTPDEVQYVALRMVKGLLSRRPVMVRVRHLEGRSYPQWVYDCECGQTLTTDLQEVSDHVFSKHGRCSFNLEDDGAPASGRVPQLGREAEGA